MFPFTAGAQICWPWAQVVQVKEADTEGYCALQLGCGAKRAKQVHGRQLGHFAQARVPIKRKLAEFRVSKDALLPSRTEIRASHFTAGQYVDVQGASGFHNDGLCIEFCQAIPPHRDDDWQGIPGCDEALGL